MSECGDLSLLPARVRDQARDSLGTIGGPEAVSALLQQATDPSPRVRAESAKALAKAADSDPRAASRLMVLAQDSQPEVRAAVLSGLATVTDHSSRWAHLAVGLAGDPDALVRHRVAVVAAHLAPDQATDLLLRLADDAEKTVRRAAATQLDRLPR